MIYNGAERTQKPTNIFRDLTIRRQSARCRRRSGVGERAPVVRAICGGGPARQTAPPGCAARLL